MAAIWSAGTAATAGPSIAAGASALTVTPNGASSEGCEAGDRDDAGLGGSVVDAVHARAALSRDRRKVHDPAGASLAHVETGDAAAEIRASKVRRDQVVPLGRIDLEERTGDGHGRVVHPRVDVAPALGRSLEARLHRVELPDVQLDRKRRCAGRVHVGRCVTAPFNVQIGVHNAVAVRDEAVGDCLTQPAGCTGHDRDALLLTHRPIVSGTDPA
jgi:hypothetical protein